MPEKVIFTIGGTVQAGGGIYLPRPADDELLRHCLAGDFSYVLTARQMGKSSLMVRTAERLHAEGIHTAIIDLTRLGTNVSAEQWYLGLVDELVEQLELDVDYRNWWQAHNHLGATQRLSRFLREGVLDALPGDLVIFIDEIDTTLSLPFSDDFFAAIRACYNARSTDPAYHRLAFVLLGVATPGDLIHDPQRTPFNIGERIDLSDFTLEETLPLTKGFDLPEDEARRVLGWVLEWTGGHPYLTQRLCRALVDRENPRWDKPAVAAAVEETFLGEHSKQDGNLQFVRDMLTRRAPKRYALPVMKTLRDIQRGREVADDEQSIPKMHLKLSGIVHRKGNNLFLRNRIYERVFDRRWLKQNWPVTPKQRLRTAGLVVTALLVGILGTFIVQNYGRDIRWQYTVWREGERLPSPVTPFQDVAGVKMVTIPEGDFEMGGDADVALAECQKYYSDCQRDWFTDEEPVHTVHVDEFAMDIYEVTNGEYRACVKAGACQEPYDTLSYNRSRYYGDPFYKDYPVIWVDWYMAQTYCAWRGARLPTEAEWEYAARGGLEGKEYPWGNSAPVCVPGAANGANFFGCELSDTMKVGTFAPNGYGLYDMAGNVWEWTADWYDEGYYANSPLTNPAGPEEGVGRVVRGGSWGIIEYGLRVSFRFGDFPDGRIVDVGFRCSR